MAAKKTATKKAPKKAAKKVAKKASAKKAAPARKITALKQPMSKAAMVEEIAKNTELSKKQVSAVLEELSILIERHIKPRSTGQFTLPGIMKIEVKKKAATKARPGINPRTGEKIMIKAKPARRVVKIRALKKVKDMIA